MEPFIKTLLYNNMDIQTQAKQIVNTVVEHREWVLWCLLLSPQIVSNNYSSVSFLLWQYSQVYYEYAG